jgi:hypothetical protein
MNRTDLRKTALQNSMARAATVFEKAASVTSQVRLEKLAADPGVQQLMKLAHSRGAEVGYERGYHAGAEDATAHILAKMAGEGDPRDPYVADPIMDAYDEGQGTNHAVETREGAEELAMRINPNDDAISDSAEMTGGVGGPAPEAGAAPAEEKTASGFLNSLLAKLAEEDGMMDAPGGGGEHDLTPTPEGADPGGDELGPYTAALDPQMARPSTQTFENLVAAAIEAEGGLDPA